MNNVVLSIRLNAANDGDCQTCGGGLFQKREAATGKVRAPTVDNPAEGTSKTKRPLRRMLSTFYAVMRWGSFARCGGAISWTQRKMCHQSACRWFVPAHVASEFSEVAVSRDQSFSLNTPAVRQHVIYIATGWGIYVAVQHVLPCHSLVLS